VRSGAESTAPPRSRLALVGRLGLVVLLLVAVVGAIVLVAQRNQFGRQDAGAEEIPALEIEPAPVQLGTVAQPSALAPPATALVGGEAAAQSPAAGGARPTLASWATTISDKVDVPARALQAYGLADLAVRAEDKGCNLSWVTIAGLARIESNHGRYRGAQIAANGDVTPRIVGVPLDGSGGNRTIGDTDGGVLDGDGSLDRAVGPLQFIPSTWAKWRSDGNGDGIADPNNIDDAALAAGRYLCAGGRDLATGPGWRAAVLSYNNSDEYGRRVYAAADSYASGSR
jgi:membrane-bound lytic murein transglycosylase B